MVTSAELQNFTGASGRQTERKLSIKAFVDSQRCHASSYAIEGKKESARWTDEPRTEKCLAPPKSKAAPLENGFYSPILQPRNPKCPSVVQRCTIIPTDGGPNSKEKRRHKGKEAAQDKNRSTTQVQTDKAAKPTGKKSMPPPLREDTGKDVSRLPLRSRKKKRTCSDSDDEKEERLALRRARRRRKKEIVNSKACEEEDSSESNDMQEQPNKSIKNKSGRNAKCRFSAGLVLMHGFNAENVGKHRLTMTPKMTSGVFNKGRASTKAKVQKKKSRQEASFNESEFLGESAHPMSASDTTNSSEKRSHSSESLATIVPAQKRKKRNLQDPVITERPPSQSHGQSEKSSTAPSVAKGSSDEDTSNCESQVWEIEKEFLQDAVIPAEQAELVKPGSVVIDSKKWDWGAFESPQHAEKQHPDTSISDRGRNKELSIKNPSSSGSAVTVTPSQSISQMRAKPSTSLDLCTKSKFFSSVREKGENGTSIPAECQYMPSTSRKSAPQIRAEKESDPGQEADPVITIKEISDPGQCRTCESNRDLTSLLQVAMQDLEAELPHDQPNTYVLSSVNSANLILAKGGPSARVMMHGYEGADLTSLGGAPLVQACRYPRAPNVIIGHSENPELDHDDFLHSEKGDSKDTCEQIFYQYGTNTNAPEVSSILPAQPSNSGVNFEVDFDDDYDCDLDHDFDVDYDCDIDHDCVLDYGWDCDYDRNLDNECEPSCDYDLGFSCDIQYSDIGHLQAAGHASLPPVEYDLHVSCDNAANFGFEDNESEFSSGALDDGDELIELDSYVMRCEEDHSSQDGSRDDAKLSISGEAQRPGTFPPDNASLFTTMQSGYLAELSGRDIKATNPEGSLGEAQVAVAKEFKRNFYPIRF